MEAVINKKLGIFFTVLALLSFALPTASNGALEGCPDTWRIDTSKYPNQELTDAKNKLGADMVATIVDQQITQYRGELGEMSKVDNLLKQRDYRFAFYYLYGESNVATTVKVEVKNCPSPRNFVFNILYRDFVPEGVRPPIAAPDSISPWETLSAADWANKNPQFFNDFKMQESFPEYFTQRKQAINSTIAQTLNNKAPIKYLRLNTLVLGGTGRSSRNGDYGDHGPVALTEGCIKLLDDGWQPMELAFGKKCTFGWLVTNLGRYAVLEPFILDLTLPTPISQTSAKAFKNCTELNKVYPGGVARPGAVNAGGATKLTPIYSKKLYDLNKKSDRDKDGIACEK